MSALSYELSYEQLLTVGFPLEQFRPASTDEKKDPEKKKNRHSVINPLSDQYGEILTVTGPGAT